MADKALEEKIAYFNEQNLDASDDETAFPKETYLRIERFLEDTEPKPAPPKLVKQKSFLGPTPKERQAEFEAHARRKREQARENDKTLLLGRPNTAPEADIASSFPAAKPDPKQAPKGRAERLKLKRNASVSDLPTPKAVIQDDVPFYKKRGVIPRELKGGKNVKLANDIAILPEDRQLFKGKVIYFFPNNDISQARRQRIHKVIQLGAAWVTTWAKDVTHVMVDEAYYTYMQVLKSVNLPALPRDVVLVKFDPYVPQCIQFNTILEPTATRFLVQGAPRPTVSDPTPEPERPISQESQKSLQVKQSRRQMAAQNGSQKTDSMSAEDSIPPPKGPTPDAPSSPEVSVVEDSFVASHPRLDTASKAVDSSQKRSRDHDDPLFEVIEQVKAVAHLPLDEEEGGESKTRPSSSAADAIDSDTDDEVPEPNAKVSKKYASGLPLVGSGKSKSFNQHAFQCMDPRATNARDDQNPNARTIQILDEMCRYYDKMGDNWRTLAYRRAITQLRKQKTKICTKDQAEALPFIGTRLAEKIEEIVLTDRLRRLDSTRDDPTDKILRLFLGIYGVGLSQAHKWIQAGHRTLDDLVKNVKLTENQKFGIEHYKDFAARIPRAEVEAHGEYVRKALRRLDPRYEVIVGGSYRRGAKDSGDIDLIISKPGASASNMARTVFERLVPKLFSAGFLKASLATSHRDDGTKWLGASCLPGSKIWRRLDMLLVPEEEMGAALIYFTGNDIFNRSIRLLASKKGMRLNQRGLYADVMRGKNRVKLTEGTLLEGKSERKIFEILGVPWREPTERIC